MMLLDMVLSRVVLLVSRRSCRWVVLLVDDAVRGVRSGKRERCWLVWVVVVLLSLLVILLLS